MVGLNVAALQGPVSACCSPGFLPLPLNVEVAADSYVILKA